MAEAQLVLALLMEVNFKFERVVFEKQKAEMDGDLQKTIKLVDKITSAKTLRSLMRTYINEIPKFFGYE